MLVRMHERYGSGPEIRPGVCLNGVNFLTYQGGWRGRRCVMEGWGHDVWVGRLNVLDSAAWRRRMAGEGGVRKCDRSGGRLGRRAALTGLGRHECGLGGTIIVLGGVSYSPKGTELVDVPLMVYQLSCHHQCPDGEPSRAVYLTIRIHGLQMLDCHHRGDSFVFFFSRAAVRLTTLMKKKKWRQSLVASGWLCVCVCV